jgi:hypothetical protein
MSSSGSPSPLPSVVAAAASATVQAEAAVLVRRILAGEDVRVVFETAQRTLWGDVLTKVARRSI